MNNAAVRWITPATTQWSNIIMVTNLWYIKRCLNIFLNKLLSNKTSRHTSFLTVICQRIVAPRPNAGC